MEKVKDTVKWKKPVAIFYIYNYIVYKYNNVYLYHTCVYIHTKVQTRFSQFTYFCV